MGENDDKVFMKRFSGIIAGLVIVTILIIIIALGYEREDPNSNPSKAKLALERVTPVAGVRTELPKTTTGPVTVEVADNVELQPTEAEAAPAASTGIDGSAIYAAACGFCHVSGAAGAPIPGSDAWAERAAKGAEALSASAIAGIGAMPAKGGRSDLSDDEIKAAVDHMLAQ